MKFIKSYYEQLQNFGDAFTDYRIIESNDTLCRIIGIRMLKKNMNSIKDFIKQVL